MMSFAIFARPLLFIFQEREPRTEFPRIEDKEHILHHCVAWTRLSTWTAKFARGLLCAPALARCCACGAPKGHHRRCSDNGGFR